MGETLFMNQRGTLEGIKPVLRLDKVRKTIRGKQIVKDLAFDVYPGEVFGFLGPNGAGKTTTIRMMVGLISMTQGDITVNGASIKDPSKALRHIGAIVENPELYRFLSGYKNLVHFARMTPGVTKQRILEVVRLVGLEDRIHDKVKTYSLGMRQRLGVAQALLHNPSILILDEPTNGLDPAGIKELRDYLKNIAHKGGIAVIVSSHLLSEMELMCDRVAIIQNGTLIDIQDIGEQSDAVQISVEFEVDRRDYALQRLHEVFPSVEAEGSEYGFSAFMQREQIPHVLALLVQSGIFVYGVTKRAKTLEDTFLEITGGSKQ